MKTFQKREEDRLSGAKWGSDVVVDLLRAYDIDYVSFNPGSSFRGLEESLVNYGDDKKPEVIECCHEETAVAIAHGYAKSAGKPMAVILHDVVGTMHASMAIYNAYVDKVPIIILSGTGPLDTTKRRPLIDWIHTALDQGHLVRDYVKWDDQPVNVASFPHSFMRGYKIAMTEPMGPVYLCLDAGWQEQRLTETFRIPEVNLYAPPTRIAADPAVVHKIAGLLVDAENPVILADWLGRNPAAVDHLVRLAELVAIPVIDLGGRFNFPNTHPLDLTGTDVLKDVDVVLGLDVQSMYAALTMTDDATRLSTYIIPETAKIVQVGLGDIGIKSLTADYLALQYVHIAVTADTSIAIPQLIEACSKIIEKNPKRKAGFQERFERMSALHNTQRMKWREEARRSWDSRPVSLARLASELWEVIKNENWVLVNGNLREWARRLWDWTAPYQYVGYSAGGGLGYGMPASIGAALAYRNTDRLCINIQSDGDLLYTDSSLWTASHHKIPLLVVMYNNRAYLNSVRHREVITEMRKRPTRLVGTTIDDPPVDFAKLAKSFGVYGEGPIEKLDNIKPALERAKNVVKKQRIPALVDVLTQPA